MYNSLKMSLSFIILFIFSLGAVQADCIVTTQNFSKSSRVIYVNPTNGSDQLAKIYNYNLGNQRNPYDPKRIVAFQNLDEALATRNTRNGDLLLIKTGRIWTRYDDWSKNKSSEFNKQSVQASGYSQRQCHGENLTWVPSAVTDTQSADTAPTSTSTTTFANTNDITVANTEIVTSRNTTSNQVVTTQQRTTSPTTSRRSSGGSSTGSNTTSPISDNILDLQKNETTSGSSGTTRFQPPRNGTTPNDQVIAEIEPDFTEVVVLDKDVSPVVNEPDNLNQDYAGECSADAPWGNTIQTYPKDSQGWSIIKPDIETKIVYVSSSEGDDNTAQIYNGSNMSNPFNPINVKAYKTIDKAYAQVRTGKPDWILFKKGDQFELEKTLWLKTGKSQNAHIVFGAYGNENSKRPIIETSNNAALQGVKNQSFITMVGLELYASGLDPKSEKFLGWNVKGGSGFINVAGTGDYGNYVQGVHLENNRISYYENGVVFGAVDSAENKNIIIRRNEILNSYSVNSHSQGVFLNNINGGLIEENIFDHNGWYQQRPLNVPLNTKSYGYATYFNHNVYIANSSNLLIKKNLSSRSSSIGIKFASNSNNETKIDEVNSANIIVENNLIVEGEVGLSIGGNSDFNNGYRWDNVQLIGNVLSNIGRTKPTNRNIAINIEVNDWKSGFVCSNVIADNASYISNVDGIITKGHIGNLAIKNNDLINLGLIKESYDTSNTFDLINSNNIYIADIGEANLLENYLSNNSINSYEVYIKSVLIDLENNSSSYYDTDNATKFIKSNVAIEKNKFNTEE